MKTTLAVPTSTADALAVEVFAHIAASEVRVSRFLQVTGLEQETVRSAARSPSFLRGVLDYVLADEDLLAEVAEALKVGPETLHTATRSLSKLAPKATELEPRSEKAGQGKPARTEKGDPYPALPRRSLFGSGVRACR